ncbi:DUF397 domain-containing protein [Micromonospora aurantiaca]|uniref:DUF397 domain-containing protein n=1 Tax=Micromonospora aurantiaca (nom. illeg.) TaxID=47850 RepID=A0ABQ6UNH5_9ACTN|nr:DUF397 domain-containing protein [Micromonospora aurantiaca]KAB1118865.1 DUF397 domain-containing protein [Micromonospora aurantiaca]
MQKPPSLEAAIWRKSSLSGDGNCVEVAAVSGEVVGVRDSKDAAGPVLAFSPVVWTGFVSGLKNGQLDRQ